MSLHILYNLQHDRGFLSMHLSKLTPQNLFIAAYRTSILLGRELNGDHRSCELFDDSKNSAVRLRKPIKSFPDIARESFGQGGTIILSFVLYFGELFTTITSLHSVIPFTTVSLNLFINYRYRTLLLSLHFFCHAWRSFAHPISSYTREQTYGIRFFCSRNPHSTAENTSTSLLSLGKRFKRIPAFDFYFLKKKYSSFVCIS